MSYSVGSSGGLIVKKDSIVIFLLVAPLSWSSSAAALELDIEKSFESAGRASLSADALESSVQPVSYEPVSKSLSAEKIVPAESASAPAIKASTPTIQSANYEPLSDTPAPLQGQITENAKTSKTPYKLLVQHGAGTTKILAGSTFPIRLVTLINSKTAKPGDTISGSLEQDVRVGDDCFAEKGSVVEGTVVSVHPASRGLNSNKPNAHFRDANGGVTFQFSRLTKVDGTKVEISARPAPNTKLVSINSNSQKLQVNSRHELAIPYHAGRLTALSIAISAGGSACGPFGMAGAPAVSAAIAALYPSYGLGRPRRVGERYGRLKAIAMGAVRGTPGGFITSGLFVKGINFETSAGDLLTLRLDETVSIATAPKISASSANSSQKTLLVSP